MDSADLRPPRNALVPNTVLTNALTFVLINAVCHIERGTKDARARIDRRTIEICVYPIASSKLLC